MAKQKWKRIFKTVSIIIGGVLLVAISLYANIKNFTVREMVSDEGQEMYFMGTFHDIHFRRYANYSMDEIVSAIQNIDPDVVFIEAREEYFKQYGVIDGPIDMCMVYGYCTERGIPVEMVDYWIIDDNFQENTTSDDRDDHIHENIKEKCQEHENEKILVVCGFGHLSAQMDRMKAENWKETRIPKKSQLFKMKTEAFCYPEALPEIWEKRALFYGHTVPQLVHEDERISDEMKANWVEDTDGSLYRYQMRYNELFVKNELYLK